MSRALSGRHSRNRTRRWPLVRPKTTTRTLRGKSRTLPQKVCAETVGVSTTVAASITPATVSERTMTFMVPPILTPTLALGACRTSCTFSGRGSSAELLERIEQLAVALDRDSHCRFLDDNH